MTLMFQFQILPNTGGFLIYSTHKCIHNRTVHRGPHWRVNHQPLDCRQYLLAGLTNLWHADPKWHTESFPCHTHSLLSQFFFLLLLPDQRLCIVKTIRVCVCVYISDCVVIVYELPLLPNNTESEPFLHKSGAVGGVEGIFITGVPAWRWLGEYVTLDKMFYNLPFKEKVVATPFTSIFSSLSHSSRRPLLDS
jgi:hypothetical protein